MITAFALKNSRTVIFSMILVVFVGAILMTRQPRLEDPFIVIRYQDTQLCVPAHTWLTFCKHLTGRSPTQGFHIPHMCTGIHPPRQIQYITDSCGAHQAFVQFFPCTSVQVLAVQMYRSCLQANSACLPELAGCQESTRSLFSFAQKRKSPRVRPAPEEANCELDVRQLVPGDPKTS